MTAGHRFVSAGRTNVKRRLARSFLLISTGVLALSMPVVEGRADMFVCSDGRGSTQFTNAPTGQDCKPFVPAQRYIESSPSVFRVVSGKGGKKSSVAYDRYIQQVGRMYNVDPYLIMAVICTESDFNHRAVS